MINILNSLCTDAAGYKIFGFVGVLLTIIKIIIPILIVIMGSIDLVKAIMAQKDDEIKKGYSTLIKRVIIGVVIFFIPGIVGLIIGLTGSTENCESVECVFSNSNECIVKSQEKSDFNKDVNCGDEGALYKFKRIYDDNGKVIGCLFE